MLRNRAGKSAWVIATWPNRLTSNRRRHSVIGRVSTGALIWIAGVVDQCAKGPTPRVASDAVGDERPHGDSTVIVERIVGPQQAQHFGALLLTNVHGITSLESSGHLISDKWETTAEQLIDTVISLLPAAPA